MLLNSMMSVPFSLQLAAGLTWLPLYTNAIGVLALAPVMFVLVRSYGLTGGAVAWLVFNIGYYLAVPPIMFRHVLAGHYGLWLRDTVPYMAAGILCFGLARWATSESDLAVQI